VPIEPGKLQGRWSWNDGMRRQLRVRNEARPVRRRAALKAQNDSAYPAEAKSFQGKPPFFICNRRDSLSFISGRDETTMVSWLRIDVEMATEEVPPRIPRLATHPYPRIRHGRSWWGRQEYVLLRVSPSVDKGLLSLAIFAVFCQGCSFAVSLNSAGTSIYDYLGDR